MEIDSPQGFAAGTSSAAIILTSAQFGLPLSTTQAATGSILGTRLGKPGAEARWGVMGRMAVAWLLTLPLAAVAVVLRRLRAGYPHGVPREDYVALFAVLHRRLTGEEIQQVADRLADGDGPIERAAESPSPQNRRPMALPALLARIVDWLRAGYPHGVPDTDYIPLLALLARRLTEQEVREVADALVQQGTLPADKADVGVIVTKLTDAMPRESDLARVRDHLAAGGWPVDDAWPGLDDGE